MKVKDLDLSKEYFSIYFQLITHTQYPFFVDLLNCRDKKNFSLFTFMNALKSNFYLTLQFMS